MLQVEDVEFCMAKALLFLQLLITNIPRSAMKVCAISNGFLFDSLPCH